MLLDEKEQVQVLGVSKESDGKEKVFEKIVLKLLKLE